jgi:RNA polymerase sigma factor (sigma-70 family)
MFNSRFYKSDDLNTHEEIRTLGRRAQAGDIEARDKLIERYTPWAIRYAERIWGRHKRWLQDDIVAAALLGLVDAAGCWNPSDDHDAIFFHFAARRIGPYVRQAMVSGTIPYELPKSFTQLPMRSWHKVYTVYRRPQTGRTDGTDGAALKAWESPPVLWPVYEGLRRTEPETAKVDNRLDASTLLDMLPDDEREIVRSFYGLEGSERKTLVEIGEETGHCMTDVCVIRKRAEQRLIEATEEGEEGKRRGNEKRAKRRAQWQACNRKRARQLATL